jgi:hypothetical protein
LSVSLQMECPWCLPKYIVISKAHLLFFRTAFLNLWHQKFKLFLRLCSFLWKLDVRKSFCLFFSAGRGLYKLSRIRQICLPPSWGRHIVFVLSVSPSVCQFITKSCAHFSDKTADRRDLKLYTMLHYH